MIRRLGQCGQQRRRLAGGHVGKNASVVRTVDALAVKRRRAAVAEYGVGAVIVLQARDAGPARRRGTEQLHIVAEVYRRR